MTENLRISGLMSLLILLLALPAAASADEAAKRELKIAIDDGTPDGQLFINLDDADSVSLHDMQVGESRSIVDESGRSILVTRTVEGLEMNVDGRIIDLPELGGASTLHPAADGETVNVEEKMIFVSRDSGVDAAGITIISGEAIDAATQDGIRALLSSAGHGSDVHFIDRSSLHVTDGEGHAGGIHHREIRVLTKERDATN